MIECLRARFQVMFTCLKRNQVKEVKVAQLCGAVAEMSSYHHGEMSLMGTIIGLAQDFVGKSLHTKTSSSISL